MDFYWLILGPVGDKDKVFHLIFWSNFVLQRKISADLVLILDCIVGKKQLFILTTLTPTLGTSFNQLKN